MQFLIIVSIIAVIVLLVMFLKKIFHLNSEDDNLSDEDDYLERRVKRDEKDN